MNRSPDTPIIFFHRQDMRCQPRPSCQARCIPPLQSFLCPAFHSVRAALLIFLAFVSVVADEGPGPRLMFTQGIGASVNPLGVLLDSRIDATLRLVKKPGILWESTCAGIGIQNEWTPADDFLAFRATIEPIAFFSITARVGFYALYDVFGFGYYGFDSPDQPYDFASLADRRSSEETGYWISAAPMLKLKAGKFIAAYTFTVNRIALGGSGYFLEI